MDEFPDPEDEYDLLHKDELDVMRELDDDLIVPDFVSKKSRQSLNFDKTEIEVSLACVNSESVKRSSCQLDGDGDGESIALPPAKKRKIINRAENEDLGIDMLDPVPSNTIKPSTSDSYIHGKTSLRFPSWNFVTINTDFNERLFVRVRAAWMPDVDFGNRYKLKSGHVSESFRQLKETAMRSLVSKGTVLNASFSNSEVVTETADLWVEQFKPKKYLELLSDEGINRALLTWIKTWDKVVFNREIISKKVEHEDKLKPPYYKGKQQVQEEKATELDEEGRPQHKIALLCGPPGIGKTTLAHVIAILAGYNVIEVNASDERTVESFRTTLQNATEMQSVIGSQKPNCLILDEIDGAPAASIDFLIKFVNGKVLEKTKTGKKEKAKKVMKRPVICICNELYTPALRNLRQQAYVLHFPHTSTTKLAQRLLDICRQQGIKTDLSTLALLCDKAQSDIRSCITTLHFFKTTRKKVFKSVDVAKASVGLKDMQKNLFSIWQEVFQKPTEKSFNSRLRSTHDLQFDYCASHPNNMKRLQHIIQLFSSAGDYEKLQQGVYENMLKMQFPWFRQSVMTGLEWFCWSDLLDTSIKHGQNFTLMPYLPYAFVSWHFLFSTTSWPKITYPNLGYEHHVKATKYAQIVADVMRGLHPCLRAFAQRGHMLLDVLPLLPRILAPPLRPVNITLFNNREKADFQHVVDTLLDFNMNYVQQRASDGAYIYTLDPSFEEVTLFPVKDRNKINQLTYNMKQIISREVQLERVRRNDHQLAKSHSAPPTINAVGAAATTSVPSHLHKLKPKPLPVVTNEAVQYKDFFGRIVQVERSNTAKNDKSNYIKSRVWFCFKEGFNNAVKKDLTIADLL